MFLHCGDLYLVVDTWWFWNWIRAGVLPCQIVDTCGWLYASQIACLPALGIWSTNLWYYLHYLSYGHDRTGHDDGLPLSKLNRRNLSLEMHLQPGQSHTSISGILRKKPEIVQVKKILCRSQAGQFKCLKWKTDLSAFSRYLNWLTRLLTWLNLTTGFVVIAETFGFRHVSFQSDVWVTFFLYDILLI